jgi:HEAT repeat protein
MTNTMTNTRSMLLTIVLATAALAAPVARASALCPSPRTICDSDEQQEPAYTAARQAFNDGDYRKAERLFADFVAKNPKSPNAGDALYYRAFSLFSIGGESNLRQALQALQTEKDKYPKAKTIDDVATLAVRIRGRLAQLGDANSAERVSTAAQKSADCKSEREDDVRSEALNALLQMDSQSAIPILKEILSKKDACTAWMRKKAVFLVSQHPSTETVTLLMDVARTDPSADVRGQAVFWMGQVHSQKAEDMLVDIATNSRDLELRKGALFALTQQQMPAGRALIRKLAESNDTPDEVRKSAIWQLGQQHSQENSDALRSIFSKVKNDEEVAKSVLFSLAQMHGYGNAQWLLAQASDRSLPEDVRKHAIFCAGQAGIPGSDLIALYDRVSDRPVKEHLIWVMSDSRDRGALDKLIDIAKNDKDVEMRKKALFWLGQKNDPRVRQLLLDIIKGE